jgi:hypothetical protein
VFLRAVEAIEGRTIAAAFFGLSSSLKEKCSSSREGEDQKKENLEKRIEYTYESSNSNISRSEPLIVVCSCGTSFRLDVPEEGKSFMHFRFLSAP